MLCAYNRHAAKSFRAAVTPRSDMAKPESVNAAAPLPLNPECSMIQDIQGVYHDPTAGVIRVVLHGNRTFNDTNKTRPACLRPYLLARLSGPAVGLVEQWSYGRIDDRSTYVEGYYHVPTTGLYFLEIIVILCNTYDDDLLRQAQQYVYANQSDEADAAFAQERQYIRNVCLESAPYNRLTARNTSIEVGVVSRAVDGGSALFQGRSDGEGHPSQRLHGFWERNESFTQQQNQADQTLYTRYEPLECWTSDDGTSDDGSDDGTSGDDGSSDDDVMCDHPAVTTHQFEPY
jgi:hypothetical protein